MPQAFALHRTTIGLKFIMALSGAALFGFIVSHLLGNLQLFIGPDAVNSYAAGLRKVPALLWVARIGLILAAIAHIGAAVKLMARNNTARPVSYKHKLSSKTTSYAARTMTWSGPIVLLYFVYHLMHLTFGVGPNYDHHNVYNNIVYGFMDWRIASVYIVSNVLLGMHLYHGAWSWLQSIGANHPRYNAMRRTFAVALAGFITIGNVGLPLSVLTGMVEPTDKSYCFTELEKVPGECEGIETPTH